MNFLIERYENWHGGSFIEERHLSPYCLLWWIVQLKEHQPWTKVLAALFSFYNLHFNNISQASLSARPALLRNLPVWQDGSLCNTNQHYYFQSKQFKGFLNKKRQTCRVVCYFAVHVRLHCNCTALMLHCILGILRWTV